MTVHHFTVDVEEYFHPTAVTRHYPMTGWDALPRRSPTVVAKLLDLLDRSGATGTFFVLGWLAEKEPAMVRAIAEGGHEIASHGYEHELVGRLGVQGFRESVTRSKLALEDACGQVVQGYRAPSFSIVPGLEWAFDVLLESGYRYDASLFPIVGHPTYGYPTPSRDPYRIQRGSGTLIELPATTVRVLGSALPASGGAYFRLLPYGLVRAGLQQASERGAPGMFYIHPWEMDDWAPVRLGSRLQHMRTFAGRQGTWARAERLTRDFEFQRIDRTLAQLESAQ